MERRGHPRSSVESAYATSCWSSIVTLVLSWPVSEILQVSVQSIDDLPRPYSTRIFGVFPYTRLPMLWLRGAKTLLVTRIITFELTQHIRPQYINVTGGQTDGRPTIAIPRFALRASAVKISLYGSWSYVWSHWNAAVTCSDTLNSANLGAVSAVKAWTAGL